MAGQMPTPHNENCWAAAMAICGRCAIVHLRAGPGGAVAAGNNADTSGDRGAAPDGQLEKLPRQVGSLEKSS